jgi:hypothetical protein
MSNDTKTAKGGGGGSNQDIAQSGFFQEFFAEELKPKGDASDAGKPEEKSQPASGATGDATEAPKDGETSPTPKPADGEKPPEGGKPPADPAAGGGEQKPEGDKPKPKARAQTIAEEALGIDAPDSDAGTQDAPSQAAPVSVGDVAAVAAEAAVRAVGKVRSEAATELTPKPGDDGLTDEVRRHQSVYEELSRQNPKKYTDIAKRLSKFQQAERAYADAWERENPGSVFNADDTQHAKWYASNSVAVDREDFDDARISVRAREIVSREVQPKQAAMEREMERSRVEPEAHHAGQSGRRCHLRGCDPEAADARGRPRSTGSGSRRCRGSTRGRRAVHAGGPHHSADVRRPRGHLEAGRGAHCERGATDAWRLRGRSPEHAEGCVGARRKGVGASVHVLRHERSGACQTLGGGAG